MATRHATPAGALLLLTLLAGSVRAQPWREAASHIGTTARVLLVGVRPEDADPALMAWLSLGRHVETAYLSLTRGESGVNVAGYEKEAPLAVVRTAEVLAERERDGGRQYFTRAYDFGPTRLDSIVDVQWPGDTLLRDVVAVVRAFRPHVMIALSSVEGERDATRRRAARLAAEAYAMAADTFRFPAAITSRMPGWRVSRLYTLLDTLRPGALNVDVGAFDLHAGRSYAEQGAEFRRLQRTQGGTAAPGVGRVWRWLREDSTTVEGDGALALFAGIDTSLARFVNELPMEARPAFDSLRAELGEARRSGGSDSADVLAVHLARVARRASQVRLELRCRDEWGVPTCTGSRGDLAVALTTIRERATRGMLGAAGIVLEGVVARHLVAEGDSVPVTVTLYNGGRAPVTLRRLAAFAGTSLSLQVRDARLTVAPDSLLRWHGVVRVLAPTRHWWQVNGLMDGTSLHDFRTSVRTPVVPRLIGGEDRHRASGVEATLELDGVEVPVIVGPLTYRGATTPRSDTRQALIGVPETSVLLDRMWEYVRASAPIARVFRVYVRNARSTADTLAVRLQLPKGLTADSLTRTVALPPFGARNVFFRIRGVLPAGSDTIYAAALSLVTDPPAAFSGVGRREPRGEARLGAIMLDYPHIPSQPFVRIAQDRLEVVDVRVPARLQVAYVRGSEDLRVPFTQIGVNHQVIDAALLPVVELGRFTTVLFGVNALVGDALAAAVPALSAFVRGGGTLVFLSARDELVRSGLLPYPLAFGGAALEVRDPSSRVEVTTPESRLLRWPNVIRASDFEGWTGGRARQVPVSFDRRYGTLLSLGDPGEERTSGGVLVAGVGRGRVVVSSLMLAEQLEGGVAGGARIIVNFLAAGFGVEGGGSR